MPIKNRQKRKIGEGQKAITLFKLSKQKVHESAQLRDTRKTKYTHKKKKDQLSFTLSLAIFTCVDFFICCYNWMGSYRLYIMWTLQNISTVKYL